MTTKHGTAAEILAEIGGATFKGNVELTANTTAAELARLNNQVTGTITLFSSGQDLTGSTKDLIDALKGIKGFKGNLTVADAVAPADTVAITIKDIKALKASTQGTLTLSGTNVLASTFTTDKAADILAAFKEVTATMTGKITIIKETISLAQAKDLAALTNGAVTATIAPATADELLAVTFVTGDKLSVTVKGAYTPEQLILLKAAAGIDKISLSNKAQALEVENTGTNVADLVDALDGTGYKGNVTVTGATAITIADLQDLNNLTTGKITLNPASINEDYSATAEVLVEAFDGITGLEGDVTISSGAVTIAQLKAINKATSGDITVTADQTLSGSAKDLIEALKDVTLSANSTVKVNGPVTLAQILELQKSVNAPTDLKFANTSAALTGTTAEILEALKSAPAPADYQGAIKVTDAVNAADLQTINGKTTGKITLTNLTHALNGDADDLAAALDGITGYKGNVRVETAPTAAELLTINKATSGIVTLDVKTGILGASAKDLIAALDGITGYTGDLTIALNSPAATLAQLKTLNGLTSGDLVLDALSAKTDYSGKASDILAAFKGVTVYDGDLTITGSYTVADITALEALTLPYVLSNKAQALTVDAGDVAALVTALDGTGYKGNVTITATDTDEVALADLVALNELTTGKITLNTASKEFDYSGTAADLVKAFAGITGLTGDVTISSGAVTIAQLKAINKATSGAIDVTADQTLSESAKDLIEALKDVTLTAASTVEVTGAVTVAQILALQDTGADVSFTSPTAALTGTTADILAALASAPAGYKGAIKVTDDAYTANDLKAIQAATDGKVTLAKLNVELNDDYTDITAALDGITGYKGAITLVDAVKDTPADINDIAKLTTGKLTATLDAATDITDATVTALKDVNTKDAIIFAATDTSADATAYLALSKLIPTATFDNIATITEDAAQIGTNGKNVIDALNKLNNGDTDVTLTGTVSVASVKAINDATTGDLTVNTVKTAGGAFDLSKLGDLTEVEGLTTIDAQDGKVTNITLSIADILAANDTPAGTGFVFNIIGDSKDIVTISDAAGWTEVTGDKVYTFANGAGTVTVNLTNVYDVVLPA